MDFIKKIFETLNSNSIDSQQERPSLSLSVTEKYSTDKPNEPWQSYEVRGGSKDLQILDHKIEGKGKFAREIAGELGILCKGTENPNVKVVNAAARSLKLEQSGQKLSSKFTKNNGGSGMREFVTPLFSNEQQLKIKNEIETKSVAVDSKNGIFKYQDIPFKIK